MLRPTGTQVGEHRQGKGHRLAERAGSHCWRHRILSLPHSRGDEHRLAGGVGADRGPAWRPARRGDRRQGARGVTCLRLDASAVDSLPFGEGRRRVVAHVKGTLISHFALSPASWHCTEHPYMQASSDQPRTFNRRPVSIGRFAHVRQASWCSLQRVITMATLHCLAVQQQVGTAAGFRRCLRARLSRVNNRARGLPGDPRSAAGSGCRVTRSYAGAVGRRLG